MLLSGVVGAPFVVALLLLMLGEQRRKLAACLAGAVALGGAAAMFSLWPAVHAGTVLSEQALWIPQLGLNWSLRLDGFAWFFASLVLVIGALVVLYASYYLAKEDPAPRFFAYFLCFMGAMLGVVLAGNLLLLVLFWELTSLSSFLLIGYWRHRADARQGARMALAITGTGGLAMLLGMLLIGHIVGSYELEDVLKAREILQSHELFPAALILVLLGALTKSAQFPFHFWLPHAMAAPTPVSAYLHSATMVKAGVFLLARMWPVLAGNEWWFWIVSSAGLATLLLGAWCAMFQQDLKGLLAYSTISHLGLITLLLGLNSELAAVAAVFHIINHATFKASLFMAAGIIDHESGTRDLRKLNGLFHMMPITATLAMVASAAMAGVPLMNGFLSKEMFFAETLALDSHRLLEIATPLLATLAATFSVAYSLRFVHDVFFNGEPVGLPKTPHEPPWGMRLPVEGLVIVCLLVGLLPSITVAPLLATAAQPVVGGSLPEYSLALWHGWNLPLLMSAVALAGGTALYFWMQSRVNLHTVHRTPIASLIDGKALFEGVLSSLTRLATWLTRLLRNGSLQSGLRWLVLLAIIMMAPVLIDLKGFDLSYLQLRPSTPVSVGAAVVWALLVAATLATVVFYRQRLVAVVVMGLVGLGVALCFVYFSAPDLALTQILIEVASIILLLLGLQYLPDHTPAADPADSSQFKAWLRLADALLAVVAGVVVAAISYLIMRRSFEQSIAPYYLENTIPLGGGANAVNVIIVDFRGFDTMGEITVLGIAGLLVAALVNQLQGSPTASATTARQMQGSFLLGLVTRVMLPATFLIAVHFYLRGHNLPGGGFIGGLVLAIGVTMIAVGHHLNYLNSQRPMNLEGWIGFGWMCAVLTGAGAWVMGYPFLTTAFKYFDVPWIGAVPIASAMFFDLGVFAAVVGATVLMLTRLASLRKA